MSSEARAIRQFAELVRAGHRIEIPKEQFSERTNFDLNLLLKVTERTGGQLSATLDRFAALLIAREHSQSELALAVAGPKASSRLVMGLPILVFIGAGITGIPIFATLQTPSLIWLSLILGGFLFWLGTRWTNRMLKRAEPAITDPGLGLELVAIATNAGHSLESAVELVEQVFGKVEVAELQELAWGSGIAVNHLLVERANALRAEQFASDRLKIQKTSVSVLWPLGLTVLPAFVLIAIIPVGAALI